MDYYRIAEIAKDNLAGAVYGVAVLAALAAVPGVYTSDQAASVVNIAKEGLARAVDTARKFMEKFGRENPSKLELV